MYTHRRLGTVLKCFNKDYYKSAYLFTPQAVLYTSVMSQPYINPTTKYPTLWILIWSSTPGSFRSSILLFVYFNSELFNLREL